MGFVRAAGPVVFISALLSLPLFGEVIRLKSGRVVEGKIVEKNDEGIRIDAGGIKLSYYFENIESIDGRLIYIPKSHVPASSSVSFSSAKDPQDIFASISPAIVYINNNTVNEETLLGSGFIVGANGVIVTNFHVIQSAKEISVKLKDGRTFPVAGVVYFDANRDICILKINAEDLPAVVLGDSTNTKIGEKLYCIGNPLGYDYTFSDGMLSGIRNYNDLKWLQFTAPISSGNSGGPLINSRGEVIGMVTFQSTEGQNLNFALSINEVKPYINQTAIPFADFVEKVSQADYYLVTGDQLSNQGEYEQAIPYYEKVIQLNPGYTSAYNGLGLAYNMLARYEKAIPVFEKAIALDPTFALAYNNLGFAYCFSGKYSESISYFEKAIELDPGLAMAYNNLGVAYIFLAKYEHAITYLDKTLKVDPYYSLAYNNLGLTFYYMGQYPQAISNYETCLKIDPNYSIAHSNLGLVYAALGNDNQALACYNRALELSPDDVETFANRAQTFLHLRQYDNAWEDVRQAEALGAKIDSKFIADLKSASGRNR